MVRKINCIKLLLITLTISASLLASPLPAHATSPGNNGILYRYGDDSIREIDPNNGSETVLESAPGFSTGYFDTTSDGQNYMSMYQSYGGMSGYNNTSLAYFNNNGGLVRDFGDTFDQTYYDSMSPDGSMIAYFNVDDNNISLFDLNTNQDYRLDIPGYMDLVWSPDSSKLAFFYYDWSQVGQPTSAAYFDINTGQVVKIAGINGFPLDWSPDGRYIAYKVNGKSIKTYDVQTGAITDMNPGGVLNGSLTILSFSWSPDQTASAFITSDINNTRRLYTSDGLGASSSVSYTTITDGGTRVKWAPSADSTNVYRFWSNTTQHHFYTANFAEALNVMAKYNNDVWDYEGISYSVVGLESCGSNTSSVYRFWSPKYSSHFFTISAAERDHITSTYPPSTWTYEGVAYCAEQSQNTDNIPLYRFWSPKFGGHFYTTSQAERDSVLAKWPTTWTYEGVAYYVRP